MKSKNMPVSTNTGLYDPSWDTYIQVTYEPEMSHTGTYRGLVVYSVYGSYIDILHSHEIWNLMRANAICRIFGIEIRFQIPMITTREQPNG